MLGRVSPRGSPSALADTFLQELALQQRPSQHFERLLQALQSKESLDCLLSRLSLLLSGGEQPFALRNTVLRLLWLSRDALQSPPLLAQLAPSLLGSLQGHHLSSEEFA